jgi:oligoendopeptidase F
MHGEKLALYMWKIESSLRRCFGKLYVCLEAGAHQARQDRGELSVAAAFMDYGEKRSRPCLGRANGVPENKKRLGLGAHFFPPLSMLYAYAFGQLLSLSLFALYERGDKDFVKHYWLHCTMRGQSLRFELVKIFWSGY